MAGEAVGTVINPFFQTGSMDTFNISILVLAGIVLGAIIYLMYREASAASYARQCAEDKKGWHGKNR